jgi:S-adenosylhomocysteine hydrolase
MAQAMRMQEDINRQRSGQLWQSKLQLESYIKDNAMNVQNMSAAWVNNHAGIRDSYTSALTNMQTFWSKVMPANLVSAQAATQQNMANNIFQAGNNMMQAVNTKFNAIINGTNSIVSGIMDVGGGMLGK